MDFDMTPDIEKKLRQGEGYRRGHRGRSTGGADGPRAHGKAGFGTRPGRDSGYPCRASQAFDAIKSELDPDKAIALVDDFAKKYPESPLLSYVYSLGANSYQQKGDVEKVIEYTGKGLKLKPDNLMCLILRIGMLPQPQYLKNHEADKDKILKETQTEANHALQLISQLPKQPNEADADYQKRLANIASDSSRISRHGPP